MELYSICSKGSQSATILTNFHKTWRSLLNNNVTNSELHNYREHSVVLKSVDCDNQSVAGISSTLLLTSYVTLVNCLTCLGFISLSVKMETRMALVCFEN